MTGPALAWAFLTRIAGGVHPETDEDLGRAVPWLPWVGLIIGLAVWAVYGVATLLVPEALGAPLAILTGIALTGGLHEDGLADTFDGLGGHTPERRLEIMRDSRVGVFGVAAVVGSIVLRSTALALLSVGPALVALTAAHIVGRTSAVGVMLSATPARPDGIGAGYMGDLPPPPFAGICCTRHCLGRRRRTCDLGVGGEWRCHRRDGSDAAGSEVRWRDR